MKKTVFYLLILPKYINLKTKDIEIKRKPFCLGNTSKDFTANNMRKTGLNGYVYGFSIDYITIYI